MNGPEDEKSTIILTGKKITGKTNLNVLDIRLSTIVHI